MIIISFRSVEIKFSTKGNEHLTADEVDKKLRQAILKGANQADVHGDLTDSGMAHKSGWSKDRLAAIIFAQISVQGMKFKKGGEIILSLNDSVINRINSYYFAHVRGHKKFNPKFASGYVKPTRSGTHPMKRSQTLTNVGHGLEESIANALREAGFV